MNDEVAIKKITDLQDYLYNNPDDYKLLAEDKEAYLKGRGFEPELISSFKIKKVDDATARGGCKCSSWCGFGCFYGPQVGAEGESCVG
jgi:hypothetical protein